MEFLDPGGLGEDGGEAGRMLPTGRGPRRAGRPRRGKDRSDPHLGGQSHGDRRSAALGIAGTELQAGIDGNAELLRKAEAVRAHAAAAMGLGRSAAEVSAARLHTPREGFAFVSAPRAYAASSGKQVAAGDIETPRLAVLSMGRTRASGEMGAIARRKARSRARWSSARTPQGPSPQAAGGTSLPCRGGQRTSGALGRQIGKSSRQS